ncbi:MAG: hypothetical protein PHX18_03935 [Candidatus Gastranaerophilales bacterium]|nr:hypothetical protein [Candidatus Gastranaerophilales bacterium]
MTHIGPEYVNPNSVNFIKNDSKTETNKPAKEKEEVKSSSVESKNIPADEILNHLAHASLIAQMNIKPKKTIDVNQYNDEAAKERIGNLMAGFEAQVLKGLGAFEKEMGNMPLYQNLSESAKLELAANLFSADNM